VTHGVQPGRQLLGQHPLEAGARTAQGRLGAADALGHRGLRHQESGCHLRGGQSGDRAKGKCHLRDGAQARVAAQQQQVHRVVLVAAARLVRRRCMSVRTTLQGDLLFAASTGRLAALAVQQLA